MRKKMTGGPFYSEAFTATNSAPSGAGDGAECHVAEVGGDKLVADEWTVVIKFAGSCTTASITPYEYVNGAWVSGTMYNVKSAGDGDGGASLDLPGHGCSTRLDFHVSALGHADGITIEAHHNEHFEGL